MFQKRNNWKMNRSWHEQFLWFYSKKSVFRLIAKILAYPENSVSSGGTLTSHILDFFFSSDTELYKYRITWPNLWKKLRHWICSGKKIETHFLFKQKKLQFHFTIQTYLLEELFLVSSLITVIPVTQLYLFYNL